MAAAEEEVTRIEERDTVEETPTTRRRNLRGNGRTIGRGGRESLIISRIAVTNGPWAMAICSIGKCEFGLGCGPVMDTLSVRAAVFKEKVWNKKKRNTLKERV